MVPWLPLDLALDRLASTLYLALAAVALGFAVGVGGIPSLGQGAFMAIGAFLTAGLIARQGWPAEAAVAAGTIGAALGGAVTGLGVARLRGVLVAVSTWLLTWLVVFALAAFPVLSGGSQGIVVPQTSLAGLRLTTTVHYELALGLVALAVAAYTLLARGRPGLALAAAHQHTDAAVAVGVPVFRLRLGAFVASAAVAGLAGALTVQLAGVADPTGYGPTLSFKLFAPSCSAARPQRPGASSGCWVSACSHRPPRSAGSRARKPAACSPSSPRSPSSSSSAIAMPGSSRGCAGA